MVGDEAPKSDIMSGGSLPQLCKIDPDAFKNITEYDVTGDISCLRDNFNQFMSSVETARPGHLYRYDLQKFVEIYFDGDVVELKKGIDSLFQVNYLLVGDEADYISASQLNRLIDLLITFNRSIIQIYKYYEDKSPRSDSAQAYFRSEIERVARDLTFKVQAIIKERGDTPASLDLISVIKNFVKNEDSVNKVKALLFAKKIFFGGNKGMLTNLDMKRIIDNLPMLAGTIFDLMQSANVNFYDENGIYDFLDGNVRNIQSFLYFSANSEEVLFTLDELAKASAHFKDTLKIDLSKYPNTLLEVKKFLVDVPNPADQYNKYIRAKDLTKIFNHALYILDEGIHFSKFSEFYATTIAMPARVTHPMNDYPVTSELEQQYLNHYRKIVQNYRFYKGSFDAPFYANRFHRNARGINEVAVIEYAVNLLMKFHGSFTEHGHSLSVTQFLDVIKRFRDLLLDKEIIIQGREVASTESAMLLSNLFQFQSNGNTTLDLPEATEFAYTLLSGISIGDYIKEEMKVYCTPTEEGHIEIACFQKNFFKVLRSKYGKSFPKLFQYIDENANNQAAIEDLIDTTAKFARVCPKNPTFSNNDMVAVLGGLLNVESTLIRFDHNQDNIFDYGELMNAFDVYKNNIETLVAKTDSTGLLKHVSKEIFLFLVKYKVMPGKDKITGEDRTAQFLGFLLQNKRDITGNRTTIASILMNLGKLAKLDREERGIFDPPNLCKIQ